MCSKAEYFKENWTPHGNLTFPFGFLRELKLSGNLKMVWTNLYTVRWQILLWKSLDRVNSLFLSHITLWKPSLWSQLKVVCIENMCFYYNDSLFLIPLNLFLYEQREIRRKCNCCGENWLWLCMFFLILCDCSSCSSLGASATFVEAASREV